MSVAITVTWFVFGLVIGHLVPRLPMLIIPRGKGFNHNLSDHPRPIVVNQFLVQRVLQMRMMRMWGLVFTVLPIGFGYIILKYSEPALGMGIFLAGGWTLLSWVLPLVPFAGVPSPWSRGLAEELQLVRNRSSGDDACCSTPAPEWEVRAVRCASCRKLLLNRPRPDLGRPRSDGRLMGGLRVWMSDGYPVIASEEE